jgi:hypothetical protein
VQAVVDEAKGLDGEGAAGGVGANLGRDGESAGALGGARGGFGGRGAGWKQVQDVREDGYLWDENEQPKEYFADVQFAVKGQKKKGKRKGNSSSAAAAEGQTGSDGGGMGGIGEGEEMKTATCPVCGEFEGDERAVAHHVEGHFAEG